MTLVTSHPVPHCDRAAVQATRWVNAADHPLQDNQQVRIEVLPQLLDQVFTGFGGAVSEIGWDALSALNARDRDAFFTHVFGSEACAMQWARVPIGASDFARDAYSHCETPGDFEMAAFSIERDRTGLLPYLQAAKAANPALRLHASPWSPPGWMKHSGRMDGPEGGELRDEPAVLQAHARYLRRFCEAYAAEGLPVDRLMVQNEMDSAGGFPTCRWPPERFARFHLEYLVPEFTQAGLTTELWSGTFRSITGAQAHACLSEPRYRGAIQGVAVQYCFPQLVQELRARFPGLAVMHTESVCHRGDNSAAEAVGQFDDTIAYLAVGADTFSYWNLALDERRTSSWGWTQNSLATIDRSDHSLHWNPDAAVFAFLGQALPPGSQRVASFSYLMDTLCVRTPTGQLRLLVRNLEGAREALVRIGDNEHKVSLPGHALCSLDLP
ncbi:MAG: hypothetical protein PF961_03335 [Planctomycetota bacterium]|jgi:glucosylceramidase|nr:hypothetical protein [Planctomycetota bacterium]